MNPKRDYAVNGGANKTLLFLFFFLLPRVIHLRYTHQADPPSSSPQVESTEDSSHLLAHSSNNSCVNITMMTYIPVLV